MQTTPWMFYELRNVKFYFDILHTASFYMTRTRIFSFRKYQVPDLFRLCPQLLGADYLQPPAARAISLNNFYYLVAGAL